MALTLGTKATMSVGGAATVAIVQLLPVVDAVMAQAAVKNKQVTDPEAFALFARPGIMVPAVLGTAFLLTGIFGDKILDKRPNLQAALAGSGSGLLTGFGANLGQAIDGRNKAGMPAIFPDARGPNRDGQPYSRKLACRSIGGPGYGLCDPGEAPGGGVVTSSAQMNGSMPTVASPSRTTTDAGTTA